MSISLRRLFFSLIGSFAFFLASQIVLESYAEARAGGGRSGGFRGSRSSQSPRLQAPDNPAQQRWDSGTPQQRSPMAPGGFMRTFGTAMLGGFLGSMLFSSPRSCRWCRRPRWQRIWDDPSYYSWLASVIFSIADFLAQQ